MRRENGGRGGGKNKGKKKIKEREKEEGNCVYRKERRERNEGRKGKRRRDIIKSERNGGEKNGKGNCIERKTL